MTTNHTLHNPGTTPAGATRNRPEALAEAAWRHLLNRHQLAAVLDQLGATANDADQVHTAVAHLIRRTAPPVPVPYPIPDTNAGDPQ